MFQAVCVCLGEESGQAQDVLERLTQADMIKTSQVDLKEMEVGLAPYWSYFLIICMVHTSLEKSWNLNLTVKVIEFDVDLEKWLFAWKSHWKSVKVIKKISLKKKQFEDVEYFSDKYHVFFLFIVILEWVAIRILENIFMPSMCLIHKLVRVKQAFNVAPEKLGKSGYFALHFFYDKSMASCKTAVTPLLTHWSYCSLALSHRNHAVSAWKVMESH